MQTKNALMKNDDFDPEEAMEAVIDKRKFLIKRLLKYYSFTYNLPLQLAFLTPCDQSFKSAIFGWQNRCF